jgi:hypothetical protein
MSVSVGYLIKVLVPISVLQTAIGALAPRNLAVVSWLHSQRVAVLLDDGFVCLVHVTAGPVNAIRPTVYVKHVFHVHPGVGDAGADGRNVFIVVEELRDNSLFKILEKAYQF